MKKISWKAYGNMYDDFTKTFSKEFGSLLNDVVNTYSIGDCENVTDLYNITLETISEMGLDKKEKKSFKKFVKKHTRN